MRGKIVFHQVRGDWVLMDRDTGKAVFRSWTRHPDTETRRDYRDPKRPRSVMEYAEANGIEL